MDVTGYGGGDDEENVDEEGGEVDGVSTVFREFL